MAPSPELLAELLDLATDAAAEAAELIVEGWSQARHDVDTKSSSTDLVTVMDRASEALLVERLLGNRPDDGYLGEEGTSAPSRSGITWVCDPIDGTTNYFYGFPGFAVSVAARFEDRTVVGVVHDPLHREVFTAVAGQGARRNGVPISCSDQGHLAQSLVATGFGYDPARRVLQAEVLRGLIGSVRDVRRMGAAAVDLCSVACGRVDAYYELGLAPWDHAAGALIATEAGAMVEVDPGAHPVGAFVLAAAPGVFTAVDDLVTTLGGRSA